MSEYQYYEFLAIDHPLGEADVKELRALSQRGRISATHFVNVYNYGDFRGDPEKLIRRWFDFHLYFANWGARRLMIRLPARLVDRSLLERLSLASDDVELTDAGDSLVLDIRRDERDDARLNLTLWREGIRLPKKS